MKEGERVITCCKCKKKVENDNVNGLKYKAKSYCIDCFFDSFEPDEVDKHMMYLTFQEIAGRTPSSSEWTQMAKLIKEHKWTWRKIELMLEYVYLIEKVQNDEGYGFIGILPFYEFQAKKFYDEVILVEESVCEVEDEEIEVIYGKQYEEPKKEIKLKSIDDLLDWSEEE